MALYNRKNDWDLGCIEERIVKARKAMEERLEAASLKFDPNLVLPVASYIKNKMRYKPSIRLLYSMYVNYHLWRFYDKECVDPNPFICTQMRETTLPFIDCADPNYTITCYYKGWEGTTDRFPTPPDSIAAMPTGEECPVWKIQSLMDLVKEYRRSVGLAV